MCSYISNVISRNASSVCRYLIFAIEDEADNTIQTQNDVRAESMKWLRLYVIYATQIYAVMQMFEINPNRFVDNWTFRLIFKKHIYALSILVVIRTIIFRSIL